MFAIHAHLLPSVSTYVGAQELFNRLPISKKLPENQRHLVSKRDTDKLVIKNGDSYSFRYHRSDLVTWHSDSFVTIRPWDSVSSRIFTNRFTPPGFYNVTVRGQNAYVNAKHETFLIGREFTLRRQGDVWDIDNLDVIDPQYKYVVDQKAARPVRQKVKDYFAWCSIARRNVPSPWRHHYGVLDAAALVLSDECKFSEVWERAGNNPVLIHAALAKSGAVKKVPAPHGVIPTPSVFSPFI